MISGIVVVRGAGDIATGIIQKLYRSGFKVLALEIEKPSAIRRKVALSEAVYSNVTIVEDMKAVLAGSQEGIYEAWNSNEIPIVIDPEGNCISTLKPVAVIDAIIAKRNLGTNRAMAPITIAVGPGFKAGIDVDLVVETMRGHNLGRLVFEGEAMPDTGIPGKINGFAKERVIHSPTFGIIVNRKEIGDIVEENDILAMVNTTEIKATIRGVLRGIIRNNYKVKEGMKIADIDPRIEELANCHTISDKARTIGGAVLEAILMLYSSR